MSETLFTVRKADIQDLPALAILETQCAAESQSFRGSAELVAETPFIGINFDAVLGEVGRCVLVIESSREVCGYADMKVSNAAAMIQRIYISALARELGAGATLIDELKNVAKALGCTRIDAYALPGDRLTKNLFERAGMKARLLIASSDL